MGVLTTKKNTKIGTVEIEIVNSYEFLFLLFLF